MAGPARPVLTIALIAEVFHDDGGEERLAGLLARARASGADLAVLPELPLNRWAAASKQPHDDDAEPPGGRRHAAMSRCAAAAGIGLLGGAIVREPATGRRLNTALLFDAAGRVLHSYAKVHLPEEAGFWETSHYEPGPDPPEPAGGFGLPLGVQVCSDINRPEGSHLLGAMGAAAILCPRATEVGTWERWKLVLRANAVTSAAYVLSVNRPRPEAGVPLGGPSFAADPGGDIVIETTDTVAVVTVEGDRVARAREVYPGYMPARAAVYARGWARLAGA